MHKIILAATLVLLSTTPAQAGILGRFVDGIIYDIERDYTPRRYIRDFNGELGSYRRNGRRYRICHRGGKAFYC
jgi:hypothetical protein